MTPTHCPCGAPLTEPRGDDPLKENLETRCRDCVLGVVNEPRTTEASE